MRKTSQQECMLIDNSFGPWAGQCRGGFDFTLLFEEVVLTVPLLSIFLLISPFRLYQLRMEKVKTATSPLKIYKIIATICWAVFELALLILWSSILSNPELTRTRATIPVCVMSFAVALGGMAISWYEHSRSVRPAFILDIYLFFSILFDIARARTLWLVDQMPQIAILFTCSVCIRCVLALLESTEKRRIMLPPYSKYSKEATSGSYSRSVFFWLGSLFLDGYKNILSLDDLFPLDGSLRTEKLQAKMKTAWSQVANKQRAGSLMYTWIGVQRSQLLTPIFWRLCLTGFTFSQPFLVTRAIELASLPASQRNNNSGYGLIGAYALVYIGIAISHGQYYHRMNRAAIMMRGSVVPCIFTKTLRICASDASHSTALSLINTDIETIIPGIVHMHETWAGILEIAIAIYLLYRQIGAACAIPIAFSFAVLIVIGFMAVPIGTSQAAWIEAAQQRVANTSNTLGKVQWLRISGLNDFAFSKMKVLRQNELKVSRKLRVLTMWILTLATCTPIFSPVLTFITFSLLSLHNNDSVTISKIFTSLSLFVLFSAPLTMIIISVPSIAAAVASFERIQEYMNTNEHTDYRLTDIPAQHNESGPRVQLPNLVPVALNQSERTTVACEQSTFELQQVRSRGSLDCLESRVMMTLKGHVKWSEVPTAILEIDELSIRHAMLTVIIGPVGCGKSTLLKCLLGEMSGSSFSGEVKRSYFTSGVAYCDQVPFLPNLLIRDVIIGGLEFDPKWFQTVITACALEEDFQQWPLGEMSRVGSKGISLSGGQKQRLGLARAVYSRKELVIIDDSFSGLDLSTGTRVFDNLLGKSGLLRQGETTVVLASSYAVHASSADYIAVLDQNGGITTQGTLNETSLSSEFNLGVFKELRRKDDTNSADERSPLIDSNAVGAQTSELVTLPATELYTDPRRQTGDSTVYRFYLGAAGWESCVIFLASMVVFAVCDSFPNIWLKWWAEANEKAPNDNLEKWLTVYAALAVGSMIFLLIGTWQVLIVCITNSGVFFHDALVNTVSRASMNLFTTVDLGVTLNRFSQDLQLIDMELPTSALGVAVTFVFCVASAVLMSIASRYFAVVIPFIFLIFYFIQRFYLRTSRQMRFLDIEHKAPLYSQLMETLHGLVTIRAFRWEKEAQEKNWLILDDSQRPAYLLFCLQQWLILSVNLVVAAIAIILVTLTTTLREEIGPGYMGIAMINIITFGETSKALIQTWVALEISVGAVARVKNFVAQTELEDVGSALSIEGLPDDWPVSGKIEFRNTTAAYFTTDPILQNVTLSIASGERVGICGRTGSGKSSLVQSLFKMIPLTDGSIIIDDVPLSSIASTTVRSRMVAVSQEPYIFPSTIRENLDPSSIHPDTSIITALQKVHLWDIIVPRGGLNAQIDDNFFSHGQAQLFSLSRAILRNPKIIVLDEVGSSLDEETGEVLKQVIREEFLGVTVVAVAHRLGLIQDFDRVVVLDRGRIVEVGDPKELLKTSGSRWRELVEGHDAESCG